MARLTLANINAALAERVPGVELQKGNGYFYFVGEPVERCETTSVMTCQLTTLTLEQWIGEAQRFVEAQAMNPPRSLWCGRTHAFQDRAEGNMTAMIFYKFKVTGSRWAFPLDMLRRDRCFPATERDAGLIRASFNPDYVGPLCIELVTCQERKHWMPNERRWESFDWTVHPSGGEEIV